MEPILRKQIHRHLSRSELQLALLREYFACNPKASLVEAYAKTRGQERQNQEKQP